MNRKTPFEWHVSLPSAIQWGKNAAKHTPNLPVGAVWRHSWSCRWHRWGGMEQGKVKVTGGAVLHSGEEHSIHSREKKKKKKTRERDAASIRLSARGTSNWIRHAIWSVGVELEPEKRSERRGRLSGRAAFTKQKDKSKSEHRRCSNR